MSRLARLTSLGLLGIVLLVSVGVTGSTKKDATPTKLPPHWDRLNLTKEQTAKLHAVMGDHQPKILTSEKQIVELKDAENAEMVIRSAVPAGRLHCIAGKMTPELELAVSHNPPWHHVFEE